MFILVTQLKLDGAVQYVIQSYKVPSLSSKAHGVQVYCIETPLNYPHLLNTHLLDLLQPVAVFPKV